MAQIRALEILTITIIASGALFVTNVFAQQTTIPDWVKGIAGWWAEDKISETEFINAMEYLISQGIIKPSVIINLQNQVSELQEKLDAAHKKITSLEQQISELGLVPSPTNSSDTELDLNTEKGLATAWSTEKISDSQYIGDIQKLVDDGIIPKFNGTAEDYNPNQPIPIWIKNNARWWCCDGGVSFEDYRAGITYLFKVGILRNP